MLLKVNAVCCLIYKSYNSFFVNQRAKQILCSLFSDEDEVAILTGGHMVGRNSLRCSGHFLSRRSCGFGRLLLGQVVRGLAL